MADDRNAAVRAQLDASADRFRDVLAALVAIPSVTGDERAAQDFLEAVARDAGLQTRLTEVDPAGLADDPRSGRADIADSPRPNLQAQLEGTGGGGRSLMLSGHVDVVPIGAPEAWTVEPFGARIDGGRLYGRGALDMKGGLVAALHAITAIRAAGVPLRGDLVFESVVEEEATGNGALAARGAGPAVDAAIIPELSDEKVLVATLGVLWVELTTEGRSAYVGRAGESVNAIDVMLRLLEALRDLPGRLATGTGHPAYAGIDSPGTMNIGTIEAGDWPSSVPLRCRAGIRVSFPVDRTVADARRILEERLAEIAAADPWLRDHPPGVRYHGFRAAGWDIDPDAPIVRALSGAITDETGPAAETGPLLGAADARFFADAGIPAVYYGPAGEGQHGPDEWVDLASVERVARVLARTALEWCA